MTERSVNLIAADVQPILREGLIRAANSFIVTTLDEVGAVIRGFTHRPTGAKISLDLLGHSTREHQYLRIGTTAIDMLDPVVAKFFESIARERVLQAAGIHALRLLGCQTAVSQSGRRTLRTLARVLGVPVFGALKRLSKTHYTPTGFNPLFSAVLVEASCLAPRAKPGCEAAALA